MSSSPLSIVVLAAGKGTRMKSNKAKVLHEVFFAPMVQHVFEAVLPLQPTKTVVIIGHQGAEVEDALKSFDVEFAIQKEQLGTGHAVLCAEKAIGNDDGNVMILCGDTPLIKSEALEDMYNHHIEKDATLTLMSTILQNPTNYGRIICDASGKVHAIVEQKDASREQLQIQEINAGIYCVKTSFLFSTLKKVGSDNSQGEIYFTDIIKLGVAAGHPVEKYTATSPIDVLGVNSRVELAEAHLELRMRKNREIMLQGVTMYNPETVDISPKASVGRDCLLEAGVRILDDSHLGQSCQIGQGSILKNCNIGDNVTIGPYSYLVNSSIEAGSFLEAYSKNI